MQQTHKVCTGPNRFNCQNKGSCRGDSNRISIQNATLSQLQSIIFWTFFYWILHLSKSKKHKFDRQDWFDFKFEYMFWYWSYRIILKKMKTILILIFNEKYFHHLAIKLRNGTRSKLNPLPIEHKVTYYYRNLFLLQEIKLIINRLQ